MNDPYILLEIVCYMQKPLAHRIFIKSYSMYEKLITDNKSIQQRLQTAFTFWHHTFTHNITDVRFEQYTCDVFTIKKERINMNILMFSPNNEYYTYDRIEVHTECKTFREYTFVIDIDPSKRNTMIANTSVYDETAVDIYEGTIGHKVDHRYYMIYDEKGLYPEHGFDRRDIYGRERLDKIMNLMKSCPFIWKMFTEKFKTTPVNRIDQ